MKKSYSLTNLKNQLLKVTEVRDWLSFWLLYSHNPFEYIVKEKEEITCEILKKKDLAAILLTFANCFKLGISSAS